MSIGSGAAIESKSVSPSSGDKTRWQTGGGFGSSEREGMAELGSGVNPLAFGALARWQNLIPSFPWIAPGWRAWGRNPRKGRDQISQRSVAEP